MKSSSQMSSTTENLKHQLYCYKISQHMTLLTIQKLSSYPRPFGLNLRSGEDHGPLHIESCYMSVSTPSSSFLRWRNRIPCSEHGFFNVGPRLPGRWRPRTAWKLWFYLDWFLWQDFGCIQMILPVVYLRSGAVNFVSFSKQVECLNDIKIHKTCMFILFYYFGYG